VEHYIYI